MSHFFRVCPNNERPLVQAPLFFPCLENILEKKVNYVALNCFEKFVDWLSSRYYGVYNERYQLHLSQRNLVQELGNTNTLGTVHQFPDGTPVYDQTQDQIVSTICETRLLLPFQSLITPEYITINGKKVLFTLGEPLDHLHFGRDAHTERVIVENANNENNHLICIREIETNSSEPKIWYVDTNKVFKRQTMAGQLILEEQEVYLTENIADNYREGFDSFRYERIQ